MHIGEYVVGGVATYVNELVSYQRDRFEVYVLMSDYNSAKDFDLEPERILRYSYKRSPRHFLSAMRQIHQAIRQIEPDIIHVHSSFAGMLARGLFFFTRRKASIFYCSHGWSFLMDTKPLRKKAYFMIEKILELKTDFIVNISKYEMQQSIRVGMSPAKSRFVYSGLRDRKPEQRERGERTPVLLPQHEDSEQNASMIKLLFVGRYDRQKGLDLLLDVFRQYPVLQQHIQLYIIGDRVLEQNEWTFTDNMIRLGWVNNAEIDHYYEQCDAIIMPSRWEGLPLVALEAMKNRKPVIASNRSSLPELVTHGVNGYIFELEQLEGLKDILLQLDKSTLVAMGEAGRQLYKEKFSSDRMNEEFVSLYYEARNVEVSFQTAVTAPASRLEISKRNGD
ncbi:glycosyltransferase involved in cell wall biosynthesis [Paenibacillus barcinonensis]|uniref:Glycosyltransferase involved in cell wall biosynthesis n=1 Tax=Paenibacillus barcinonensis TaxID=198119 RepID=A0A2V4VHQ8_PAEBA|nr:glycosyltransferase involved in cell wall biosynthesis [Paenibacillus barcinonensis]